jgi:hypothetical protein
MRRSYPYQESAAPPVGRWPAGRPALPGECGFAGGEVAGREASAPRRVRLRRWGSGRPGGPRSQESAAPPVGKWPGGRLALPGECGFAGGEVAGREASAPRGASRGRLC